MSARSRMARVAAALAMTIGMQGMLQQLADEHRRRHNVWVARAKRGNRRNRSRWDYNR